MQNQTHRRPSGCPGRAVLAAMITLCAAPFAIAASSPTATVLQSTGDKSNRVDVFFVGDGYTAAELPTTYADHIDNVLTQMFDTGGLNAGITNPYARYQNFFNVLRIDIESNESGVDRIGPNGLVIESVDTALNGRLGATFGGVYAPQALSIDYIFAAPPLIDAAAATVGYTADDADWEFAAINTTLYGGGGYSFATFTAGHPDAGELALHEGGHWNHDLGDEYGGSAINFPFATPEVNLDTNPSGDDWNRWIGFNDPQTGFVGAFEGGRGYDFGVYHPSADSKMNSLNQAFDPIAREKIVLDIYALVDPIDNHANDAQTYGIGDDLWIDVIDPAVLGVQWLLGDAVISEQQGETLDLAEVVSLMGPGEHTITARAYDTVIDHAFSNNDDPHPLDLVRTGLETLEQSIGFNVEIDWLPGDANLDGQVDQTDLEATLAGVGGAVTPGDAGSGDMDGDGVVGINDLEIVLAQWTGQAPPAAVPEPAITLPILAGLLVVRRRRRQ